MRRARQWVRCRALAARCAVIGHRYGLHFTDMIASMTPEDGEAPWCDRCGREMHRMGEGS